MATWSKNRRMRMRSWVILLCVFSIILSPVALYAQEVAATAAEPKPIQFLTKHGYVDNTSAMKEPARVDWVTGKGRKDGVLEWAVDDNYLKKLPGMFGRGFSNVTFGWADILTHPFRWSKNAPAGLGTVMGLIMGPFVATLRTTSGAVDIATCWVPFWHGVPMKKPVLGLHDVQNYGAIEDVNEYNHQTKRFFFNKLSDEY